MWSLGFGLERVAWLALEPAAADRRRWPSVLVAASVFGLTQVKFDEDLRAVFAGENDTYRNYVRITEEFVDPENENLLARRGQGSRDARELSRSSRNCSSSCSSSRASTTSSRSSRFATRRTTTAMPRWSSATPSLGLTPELADEIRAHPLLGEKLLSPGRHGDDLRRSRRPSGRHRSTTVRALKAEMEKTAATVLEGTDLTATVTGFPAMRAGIIDILIRDQLRLNLAGVVVGFLVSLVVFRSLIGAVMTAVPAIIAGLAVLGGMGLLGVPMTAMSNIIPALAMIVGFADGIHLSHAWRHRRDEGLSPWHAERAGPGPGRRRLHADRDHDLGLLPRAHHLRRRDPSQFRLDRRDRHPPQRHDRHHHARPPRPVARALLEGQAQRIGARPVQAARRALRRALPLRRRAMPGRSRS